MKNALLSTFVILIVGSLVLSSSVFQGPPEVEGLGLLAPRASGFERQLHNFLRFLGVPRGGSIDLSIMPTGTGDPAVAPAVNIQPNPIETSGPNGTSLFSNGGGYWDSSCKQKVSLDGTGFTFSPPDANGNGTISGGLFAPNGTYSMSSSGGVFSMSISLNGYGTTNISVAADGSATATASDGTTYSGTVTGSGTASDPYSVTMTSADGTKSLSASWHSAC